MVDVDREIEVRLYTALSGRCPFEDWLATIRDQNTRYRVDARIARLRSGNLGDTKSVGGGIQELRLAFGPGYRVYFGRDGRCLIILLCGGDKRRQAADIARARLLWMAYLMEKKDAHD